MSILYNSIKYIKNIFQSSGKTTTILAVCWGAMQNRYNFLLTEIETEQTAALKILVLLAGNYPTHCKKKKNCTFILQALLPHISQTHSDHHCEGALPCQRAVTGEESGRSGISRLTVNYTLFKCALLDSEQAWKRLVTGSVPHGDGRQYNYLLRSTHLILKCRNIWGAPKLNCR